MIDYRVTYQVSQIALFTSATLAISVKEHPRSSDLFLHQIIDGSSHTFYHFKDIFRLQEK